MSLEESLEPASRTVHVRGSLRRSATALAARAREGLVGKRSRLIVLAPVICLAVWASGWVLVNTAHDIDHADPDGASYIGTADQIRSGHGPVAPSTYKYDQISPDAAVAFDGHVPSTHFPPGYPFAMAAVSAVTGGTRSAARVINVACAFLNVLLLGVIAARLTAYRSVFAATAPVVLVLFVPDRLAFDGPGWLQLFLGVYSEPLFIFCVLGALLAAADALTDPSARMGPGFVVLVTLCAAALLIRYAGISLVLTLVLVFALVGVYRRSAERLWQALVLGIASVLPMLLFLGWSAAKGASGARTFAYHPSHEKLLVERLGRFVVPFGWSPVAQMAGAAIVAAFVTVGVCWRPTRVRELWSDDDQGLVLQRLVFLFIASYLVVLLFTRIFADITTPYDARLVAPTRGLAYALIVAVAYRFLAAYAHAAVIGLVAAVAIGVLIHADWATESYWFSRAYSPTRRHTPTEKALEALPRNALIVTNTPFVAYLNAGRASLILPQTSQFLTNKPNPAYGRQLSEWGRILKRRGGYGFFTDQFVIATPDELAKHVHLQLISQSGEETLYRIMPTRP